MSATDSPSSTDQVFPDLLQQARLGSSAAMNQILELPRDYLLKIAGQRIPPQHRPCMAPSDAVQITLQSAHRHFEQFRGDSEGEFIEWLRMILVNTIKDFIRSAEGRRRQHVGRVISLEDPAAKSQMASCHDAEPSVCHKLIKQEVSATLRRCMEVLPECYRKVLQFRYDQPQRMDEIAAALGMSREAAEKTRGRALRALAHLVQALKIIDDEV